MRAQITLEALVLAAMGISLLLIASVAIQRLGSAQQDAHSFSLLASHAHAIANSADEICVLGEGNSRVVPLSQYAFEIESGADKKGIILKRDNFPNALRDKKGRLKVAAAVGPTDFSRVQALKDAEVDIIVVDTSHGHSVNVIEGVKKIKKKFNLELIAGNVATAKATVDLIKIGRAHV